MKEYPFSQQTLGQILEDKAETGGDKVFLQFDEGKEFSYQEVNEITNRIANGLRNLGLEKGDKVAAFLPNCLEAAYLWFGVSKAGMIDVPINIANKGDFLSHIINSSDSKVMIIDRQLIDRLKFIENDVPKLEKVVVVTRFQTAETMPELRFEVFDYNELANSSP